MRLLFFFIFTVIPVSNTLALTSQERQLLDATYRGAQEKVEVLLRKGVNINIMGPAGETPLHSAARRGHMSIVRLLVQNGAYINRKDGNFSTPLTSSIVQEQKTVALYLLSKGADPNEGRYMNSSALMWALIFGYQDLAQKLIDKGANVHYVNDHNMTVMSHAICGSDLRFINKLVEMGVPLNWRDQFQRHPVMHAAGCGRIDVIQYLISHLGKKILFYTDENGLNSLFYAAKGNSISSMDFLLKSGVDINALNKKHMTVLLHSIEHQKKKSAQYLIRRDINLELEDHFGRTALIYAARRGYLSLVKELIAHGANINHRDCFNQTAFMRAITNKKITVARLLLKNNAELSGKLYLDQYTNCSTNESKQRGVVREDDLLTYVTMKKYEALALQLLNHGAHYNGDENHTPLEYAISNNMPKLSMALIKRRAVISAPNKHRTGIYTYSGIIWNTARNGMSDVFFALIKFYPNEIDPARAYDDGIHVALHNKQYVLAKQIYVAAINHSFKQEMFSDDLDIVFDHGDRDLFNWFQQQGVPYTFEKQKNQLPEIIRKSIAEKNFGRIAILLENGLIQTDSTVPSIKGMLATTILNEEYELAISLLDMGAPVNEAEENGVTPLMAAVVKNRMSLARKLLEQGADVNAATLVSRTSPLMIAARHANKSLISLLLEHGADKTYKDKFGRLALHYVQMDQDQTIKLLLR